MVAGGGLTRDSWSDASLVFLEDGHGAEAESAQESSCILASVQCFPLCVGHDEATTFRRQNLSNTQEGPPIRLKVRV